MPPPTSSLLLLGRLLLLLLGRRSPPLLGSFTCPPREGVAGPTPSPSGCPDGALTMPPETLSIAQPEGTKSASPSAGASLIPRPTEAGRPGSSTAVRLGPAGERVPAATARQAPSPNRPFGESVGGLNVDNVWMMPTKLVFTFLRHPLTFPSPHLTSPPVSPQCIPPCPTPASWAMPLTSILSCTLMRLSHLHPLLHPQITLLSSQHHKLGPTRGQ